MARLDKSFQDYFKLPILLRPVGDTPMSSVHRIYQGLSCYSYPLLIDEKYQPLQPNQFLQARDQGISQHFDFQLQEFQSEWNDYEIIYQCRFVVGIYDPIKQDNLTAEWGKMVKSINEEGKKVGGLILCTTKNCELLGVSDEVIIVPEKINVEQIYAFLEPWLYILLAKVENQICRLILQLKKQDNNFIVFNKYEQKPQPKTLKRKKKARCLKLCGDLLLNIQFISQAYKFYLESEEILRKLDDYVWLLGCQQGKLACFTTDFVPQGQDKHEKIDQYRQQCVSLGRRIKIPQLQTQNYFKILKIYVSYPDKFDEMANQYIVYATINHSTSQRFSIFIQLAMLYRQAGMIRKHNSLIYRATVLAIQVNPKIVNMLLMTILQTNLLRDWPTLHATVIKMIINNGVQAKEERLHLELLESCVEVLSERDIQVTLQTLHRRNFSKIELRNTNLFELRSVCCVQTCLKPKQNKISKESPKKGGVGFFMNWRKKQTVYNFQQNQIAEFKISIKNKLRLDLNCFIKMHFNKFSTDSYSTTLKSGLNTISMPQKFKLQSQGLIILETIQVQIFNFSFSYSVSPIKIQVYEEYPHFQICVPEVLKNQQSSLFKLPITINRDKSYLHLELIKLNIAVFYTLQVGFQQTQITIDNFVHSQKYLIVSQDYPYQHPSTNEDQILIRINKFKVDKKYLKKVEIRLQAIRHADSKYQIASSAKVNFQFIRSIWCEVDHIATPHSELLNIQHQNIVENYFILYLNVMKKENNLTPYQITSENKKFTLSQETTIQIAKKIHKINKQAANSPIVVQLNWKNLTKNQEYGTILFDVPVQQKMIQSDKTVKFQLKQWNGQPVMKIKQKKKLHISYEVTQNGQNVNLDHQFVIQATNLVQLRKYTIEGKKKIKSKKQTNKIQNDLSVKFFFQYKEFYLLGLKFEDQQVYWHPCVLEIVKDDV